MSSSEDRRLSYNPPIVTREKNTCLPPYLSQPPTPIKITIDPPSCSPIPSENTDEIVLDQTLQRLLFRIDNVACQGVNEAANNLTSFVHTPSNSSIDSGKPILRIKRDKARRKTSSSICSSLKKILRFTPSLQEQNCLPPQSVLSTPNISPKVSRRDIARTKSLQVPSNTKIQGSHSLVLERHGIRHVYSNAWQSEVFSFFEKSLIRWEWIHSLSIDNFCMFFKHGYSLSLKLNSGTPGPEIVHLFFNTHASRLQFYRSVEWHLIIQALTDSDGYNLQDTLDQLSLARIHADDCWPYNQNMIYKSLVNHHVDLSDLLDVHLVDLIKQLDIRDQHILSVISDLTRILLSITRQETVCSFELRVGVDLTHENVGHYITKTVELLEPLVIEFLKNKSKSCNPRVYKLCTNFFKLFDLQNGIGLFSNDFTNFMKNLHTAAKICPHSSLLQNVMTFCNKDLTRINQVILAKLADFEDWLIPISEYLRDPDIINKESLLPDILMYLCKKLAFNSESIRVLTFLFQTSSRKLSNRRNTSVTFNLEDLNEDETLDQYEEISVNDERIDFGSRKRNSMSVLSTVNTARRASSTSFYDYLAMAESRKSSICWSPPQTPDEIGKMTPRFSIGSITPDGNKLFTPFLPGTFTLLDRILAEEVEKCYSEKNTYLKEVFFILKKCYQILTPRTLFTNALLLLVVG